MNLIDTISILEGYLKKRPYISDYSHLIEQSITLCLQKDFAGAISITIPIIEGSIRKYLDVKGKDGMRIINIKDILKAKDLLINDYVELSKDYLVERYKRGENEEPLFDCNQIEQYGKLSKKYISLWLEQFTNYLSNNLFLDTRKETSYDLLNRHLIFHGFESIIYYSFSNYIRLFNCLIFLAWIFSVTSRNHSMLVDEVDNEIIKRKWVQYLKIIIASEALTKTKKEIYGDSLDDNIKFLNYMPKPIDKIIALPTFFVEQLLNGTEIFLKK